MKRTLFAIALALVLPAAAMAQPAETLTIVSGEKTHAVKVDVAETKPTAVAGLAGRAALAHAALVQEVPTGAGDRSFRGGGRRSEGEEREE